MKYVLFVSFLFASNYSNANLSPLAWFNSLRVEGSQRLLNAKTLDEIQRAYQKLELERHWIQLCQREIRWNKLPGYCYQILDLQRSSVESQKLKIIASQLDSRCMDFDYNEVRELKRVEKMRLSPGCKDHVMEQLKIFSYKNMGK